jgi:hypothetical protein
MDPAQIFADVFPIGSQLSTLELVEVSERGGAIMLTVRLFHWSMQDGQRTIADIKEQEVYALGAAQREDPRLAACVAGWAEAVRHVFEQDDEHAAELVHGLMPHELVVIRELLALRRPRTAEDFTDAALSGRKRLGGFLRS